MAELKIDSSAIDPIQRRTYEAIVRVASEKQVPFIIVGASARDLVMHHGYGAQIQRATRDIDLAVQVEDWESFDAIKTSLIASGYRETKIAHRLVDEHNMPLDIIPFGPLAGAGARIEWPDEDRHMGVMGFTEALASADLVIVGGQPPLDVPVASPVGLALLKLVSWSEREPQVRRKDAADFFYLLHNYENIPAITDRLYGEHADILEKYGWDTRMAAAHVLGADVARAAEIQTLLFLKSLLYGGSVERLCADAGAASNDVIQALVSAFRMGMQA
ncbi:hypothetical protein RE428_05990 [Marinobacter nanhaiticus D15-8W]|uniref:Nucleotidyltransferase n=1 Tax=Marinobacter nanhaiticus D15-8W TaxID=626887 RepID=N6WTC8_9GAMM|nr:nucleotidyl transferase AbiEii/AbiGii toxin family protein [Marinobacter nanhaiticus]ENO14731.1 hypothetical protein J057_05251 [Marinobacter nanhaiticus D15-8W]BES69581.1 hypothetical protein RE428_05990 [Marinobacter nanhaiticus D15-8W]